MSSREQIIAAIVMYSLWLFILWLCLCVGIVAALRRRVRR